MCKHVRLIADFACGGVSQASALDLEPFLAQVKDKALKHSLEHGLGYIHETMPQAEQDIVTTLFASNAIQVCGLYPKLCLSWVQHRQRLLLGLCVYLCWFAD